MSELDKSMLRIEAVVRAKGVMERFGHEQFLFSFSFIF